ncbi:uncharacterized protein PGTG_10079 [Puccinia graminis f. sp. tritici CRL 75-36-700-3]|uniref:Uncharacterized protein n=1 Tax=Puccinia graminis f. sp. tritici (strain CRL 75-36-700-3 / race SCCL) TaxID=418459 RepID=E3KJ84_PUCGT|nr:uncharacterized protein PGTG_10079 [Puccinia graminis f. sp. tritici CRL 75-36-700-3]EFP84359.2 hypothetical protein PGTG_10079 [Puccinia graminis f. sp. tritici CRL 75-36-700-3]
MADRELLGRQGYTPSTTEPLAEDKALIVCLTHNFVPGIVLLYDRLGMVKDVLRFKALGEIDRQKSWSPIKVIKILSKPTPSTTKSVSLGR